MIPGLQTHFNARVDKATLQQVRVLGFRMVRIDAQDCSNEVMLEMIEDVRACDLLPLVIISNINKLYALSPDIDVEWTNEPDGDIAPHDYYPTFHAACTIAKERGIRLWAPAISNLDDDSLHWLNQLREVGQGWPDGLYGISVHRYGDGLFETWHHGFASRESEVEWLEAACQDLPYIISEVGYPTVDGLTEEQQAERLKQELDFFARAYAVIIFQLNDGPGDDREARYGIRRFDRTWKPSAFILQSASQEHLVKALPSVYKSSLISLGGSKYAVRWPRNSDTVLSIQPDGTWETRPETGIGAWESGTLIDGKKLVFEESGEFGWTVYVHEEL